MRCGDVRSGSQSCCSSYCLGASDECVQPSGSRVSSAGSNHFHDDCEGWIFSEFLVYQSCCENGKSCSACDSSRNRSSTRANSARFSCRHPTSSGSAGVGANNWKRSCFRSGCHWKLQSCEGQLPRCRQYAAAEKIPIGDNPSSRKVSAR